MRITWVQVSIKADDTNIFYFHVTSKAIKEWFPQYFYGKFENEEKKAIAFRTFFSKFFNKMVIKSDFLKMINFSQF